MENIRPYLRALRGSIGQVLHAQRRAQNISLYTIEKRTGLPPHCVDQIELGKGDIALDKIVRLALFLNLEIEVVFKKQN